MNKERRELRHQLQAEAKRRLSLGYRLNATVAQQKAAVRIAVDRAIAAAVR